MKLMTKGWQLCVKWNDEPTLSVPLKGLKETNPIKVTEYTVNLGLVAEPAFAWWVPYTLKKSNRLVRAIKKQYFRKF